MEKNKTKIVTIASLLALVILIIGATYAYFQAQTGEGSQTDIRINANTVDTLTFETGDPITLTLDQENFAQGTGNQTGSTFAKALLTANSKTNTATQNYYLYLSIYTNTFGYSINTDTPELILSITDSDGNAVTNISSLTYKTVTDASGASISGYDITGVTGLVTILDNREITANPRKEEQWNITITMINYNADQSKNAGKNFGAKVVVKKGGYNPTIADYCSDGENLKDCIIKYGNLGYDTSRITIHNASLANGAGDNSYRYSGRDAHPDYYSCKYNGNDVININEAINNSKKGDCSNVYKVTNGSDVMYGDKSFSKMFTDKTTVKWDSTNSKCITDSGSDVYLWNGGTVTQTACTGNAYFVTISSQYWLGIEEVGAGEETLVSLAQEDVSNFVCFGSTASPCPTDNLYQIIGVIDGNVKLIKYDYATSTLLGTDGDYSQNAEEAGMPTNYYKGTKEKSDIGVYYWNYKSDTANYNNTWSKSLLNKTNLNTNFINNIGTEWANKIAVTTWKVGGNTWDNIGEIIPSLAYQNEIVNPNPLNSTDNATEYKAKIGLMYVSEYGFAASPELWTTVMKIYNYFDATSNNWMYMGLSEWTISRSADDSDYAFNVQNASNLFNSEVFATLAVRPSFNLESSITYKSGSGSMSDPIIIN